MINFNFDVITLFPKAFELINNLGVITKALDKNLIDLNLHDLRGYGEGSYRQVDDKPYGGGAGMVLKPEPIYKAYESIRKSPKSKTLLMTPQGKVLKQKDLARWTTLDQIIIIWSKEDHLPRSICFNTLPCGVINKVLLFGNFFIDSYAL